MLDLVVNGNERGRAITCKSSPTNKLPVPLYDVSNDLNGTRTFTVRRYNRRAIDFAGIRKKTLERIKANGDLPADTHFDVQTVRNACMICKRNFAIFAAVTYFNCGHSCLCNDCDDQINNSVCVQCKSLIVYKLKYKTY
ncbi:ORF-94 [Catopsilia pomona nucleopolyhedrovirus]|uniref:ORF-94 n=1 Tax=Catopsilia pomona nucleopolyhedrovirus TaxID=1850906 RepID=A0A172WZH1_9ABAC|nr:ORF-94 [Catopsilia pomona nucleopolyhedrovirus]ANF29742.1 ORF-94 [Catopsilia pomona nucleopolyhedrovirus]